MHQKDTIRTAYTEGANATIKYLAPRNMQYPVIDKLVWEFFCDAQAKNIPVNGHMLQSEGNKVALKPNKMLSWCQMDG